jgi:formylglycine-generating enzyme
MRQRQFWHFLIGESLMGYRQMNWMGLLVAFVVLASGIVAQAVTITHPNASGVGSTTINMDFVNIGNAGNTADDTGKGAVGYDYRIGTYEVTADQWAAVLAAAPSVGNAGNWSGTQPTTGTSWCEAAKFCNWLTTGDVNSGVYNTSTWAIMDHQTAGTTYGTAYFIPTVNEWYKAAYYDGTAGVYYEYPTGSNIEPDGIDFEGDTVFDAVFNQDNQNYSHTHPNSVSNAGVASPYGTIAQGGNAWEWNETILFATVRGVRGGGWEHSYIELEAWNGGRFGSPTSEDSDVGFRVASVPEPVSLIMMAGIALTALLYFWRKHA